MENKMYLKLSKMYVFFFIISILGWIYEVFLDVVIYRWGFTNRGVLIGPYCPVYGCGAIAILFCLKKLMKKKIRLFKTNITPAIVFVGIVVITTIIELIASYIMEFTTGSWLWDYTRFSFNFEGRIALNPSIRFGIGGMIILYVLYPVFEKFIKSLGEKRTVIFAIITSIIMLIDAIFVFVI